jgi:hypothetical protein
MVKVNVHGCTLGLKSVRFPDTFVKKPWTIATTSPDVAKAFGGKDLRQNP